MPNPLGLSGEPTSPPSEKSSPVPNPSTSVYGLVAVKSNPGIAASPSNMTSTKTVQVEDRTSSNALVLCREVARLIKRHKTNEATGL